MDKIIRKITLLAAVTYGAEQIRNQDDCLDCFNDNKEMCRVVAPTNYNYYCKNSSEDIQGDTICSQTDISDDMLK